MTEIVRIRVTTTAGSASPQGQDMHVTAVMADGTESPIMGIEAIKVWCDGRHREVKAALILRGVELDLDALPTYDSTEALVARHDMLAREVEQLRKENADLNHELARFQRGGGASGEAGDAD